MKIKWLEAAVKNPVESVIFIFSIGLMLSALYIISPFFVPSAEAQASPVASALPTRISEFVLGGIFLGVSIPGVFGPFSDNQPKWSRRGALCIFLTFFFLALLRVLVFGFTPATWIPLLMISLASGLLRLHLDADRQ